ncbi:unnamed protein product [Brachionus calyciflorus]|uniref:Ubiquitin carboxyl-terminal hydrolase MINDY n=1 Tax=Brachionus calyciflorus TaxID=104777 RepID=A0A813M8D6_9BILA|nr:unnamed protein product [Brachionus calyciflorus]
MSFIDDDRSASVSDIRISSVTSMRPEDELNNDEIKKLSEYFEKSREEIQKKVNSLLNFDFNAHVNRNMAKSASSNSLKTDNGKLNVKNYKPIDLETATNLRELTIGSIVHTFSNEWRRAKFTYRTGCDDLIYGLISEKNGSRGLILSVQAVLIKNLILMGYRDIHGNEVTDSEWRNKRKILKPNDVEKRDVLIRTIIEILWVAGEKNYACVVLNSGTNCFDFSAKDIGQKSKYFGDGITERLHIYEFTSLVKLEEFVKKNLSIFQKEDGCLLFLYSLILSRKVDRLKEDIQNQRLIGDMEECKISLFNLVLTGSAVPYLHNGSIVYDSEGQALEKPLIGIKNRNDVGILYWDPKEDDDKRTEVGSMLKTPKYPIWLVLMGKNQLAILFNTNIDLMNNWRLEQNFNLHFYSGLKKQEFECVIDVSTRDENDLIMSPHQVLKAKYSKFKLFDEEKDPEIYEIIKTKWPNCTISGDDGKDLMALL